MAVEMLKTRVVEPNREQIPPLENGDHLTRYEFHRRYEAMPGSITAELVEGVVYMSSPVRVEHGGPHADVMTWLGNYRASSPWLRVFDNTTVHLDADNEVQPDALLRILPEAGGQSSQDANGYLNGAPELVVEIAVTSATFDLYEKLNAYRRNGVQEYIVWQVLDKRLDWFRLRQGKYERVEPDTQNVIHSEVFPGLVLAVNQLLSGELAAVLEELQRGISSAEHQAFVRKLQAQADQ